MGVKLKQLTEKMVSGRNNLDIPERGSSSVPFQAIFGPKFGLIPNGKTSPFFPIGSEKFPIRSGRKIRKKSSFLEPRKLMTLSFFHRVS